MSRHLFRRPRHIDRTPQEEREIEETVAAIRLRTRHHDPYEEWEKQTRKDAFVRSAHHPPSSLKPDKKVLYYYRRQRDSSSTPVSSLSNRNNVGDENRGRCKSRTKISSMGRTSSGILKSLGYPTRRRSRRCGRCTRSVTGICGPRLNGASKSNRTA